MRKRGREEDKDNDEEENRRVVYKTQSLKEKCLYCGLEFGTYLHCESHIIMAHQNSCTACDKVFPSEHILYLHIDEVHNPILELKRKSRGVKTFRCFVETCDAQFHNHYERRLHLIQKHKYPHDYPFVQITTTGI
ncbi:uncharacterized protein LODBEIA_P42790 [Lodderomyces beijingensis]|uniref:C2H2-type domain-containing protein n=1 Tax=Lodderomyces beijingensis TaxID=1775926 RepID=A0ABP0ZS74_9ASCO